MPHLAHLPSLSSSPAQPPSAADSVSLPAPPLQQRLEQLEGLIRHYNGHDLHADWLNEYLDLGLELASFAGHRQLQPLQESWLTRLYNTLRDGALNPLADGHWRHLCLDYLYQPFFALTQIYRQQPGKRFRLLALRNEFSTLSRLG